MLASSPVCTTRVIAARVIEVISHPRADRIWIAKLDTGLAKASVVFGGTGPVRANDLVAYAPPGAVLCGFRKPQRMRRRRYRGEVSEGMLCSAEELGWAIGSPDEVLLLADVLLPGASLDDADPVLATRDHAALAPFIAAARAREHCATAPRRNGARSEPAQA